MNVSGCLPDHTDIRLTIWQLQSHFHLFVFRLSLNNQAQNNRGRTSRREDKASLEDGEDCKALCTLKNRAWDDSV